MHRRAWSNFKRNSVLVAALGLVLSFQNCSGSFRALSGGADHAPASLSLPSASGGLELIGISNGPLSTKLNCGIDGMAIPATTHTYGVNGSTVSTNVSVAGGLGGIPTELWLKNNFTGHQINIIEGRSAAGAAWNNSIMALDGYGTHILLTNQSGGNSMNQWGYEVALENTRGFAQTDWTPQYLDHYHDGSSYADPVVPQSPCAPETKDWAYYDAQWTLRNDVRSTRSGAKTSHFDMQFAMRARQENWWRTFQFDQAMYIRRQVAREHDLRVILVGKDRAWIKTVNPVDAGPVWSDRSLGAYGCNANAPVPGCGMHTPDLDYAIFVFNVDGLQIGMAVHRPDDRPFQIELAMESSITNFGEGSVNFHNWLEDGFNPPSAHHLPGQIVSYMMSYEVGSLDELAQLGYGSE